MLCWRLKSLNPFWVYLLNFHISVPSAPIANSGNTRTNGNVLLANRKYNYALTVWIVVMLQFLIYTCQIISTFKCVTVCAPTVDNAHGYLLFIKVYWTFLFLIFSLFYRSLTKCGHDNTARQSFTQTPLMSGRETHYIEYHSSPSYNVLFFPLTVGMRSIAHLLAKVGNWNTTSVWDWWKRLGKCATSSVEICAWHYRTRE